MLRIIATALALTFASAAKADSVADCQQMKDINLMISACTEVINAGAVSSFSLSGAHANRGYAYKHTGDLAAAIADLTRAIEIDKSNYFAYFDRGKIYQAQGDTQRMEADFQASFYEAEVDCFEPLAPQNGITACTFLIAITPTDESLYSARAVSYEDTGDAAAAIADYRKILEMNPENEPAKSALQRLGVTP